MVERVLLICDNCGVSSMTHTALNWIHVTVAGIDATSLIDRPLNCDLCSVTCAIQYLVHSALPTAPAKGNREED